MKKVLTLLLLAYIHWTTVEGIEIDSLNSDSLLIRIEPNSEVTNFLQKAWSNDDYYCSTELILYKFPQRIGKNEYYLYSAPTSAIHAVWYGVSYCSNIFEDTSIKQLIINAINNKGNRYCNKKIDFLQTVLQICKPWMYPYNNTSYYYGHHDFGFWVKSSNEKYRPLLTKNFDFDSCRWQITNDFNNSIIDKWVIFTFGRSIDYDVYKYRGKKEETVLLVHVYENNHSAIGFVFPSRDCTAILLWSDVDDLDVLLAISKCVVDSDWSNKEKVIFLSAIFSVVGGG